MTAETKEEKSREYLNLMTPKAYEDLFELAKNHSKSKDPKVIFKTMLDLIGCMLIHND